MTIEALEYTIVYLPGKIEYSFNGGNTWEEGGGGLALYLQKGAMVSFRNMEYREQNSHSFDIRGSCNLVGNCMSLIPDGKLYKFAFNDLFENCDGIISVSEGFLPATTLADLCYSGMFAGCTSLINAPALPATTLASNCYSNMFYGCTSLVNAPELPATTLAYYCYGSMFYGCTSLVNAPELPASTLVDACYSSMFNRCTKLNYIKMLATDISATQCLSRWVYRVASSGTFVKNKNATWNVTGVSGVPSGWTIQKV